MKLNNSTKMLLTVAAFGVVVAIGVIYMRNGSNATVTPASKTSNTGATADRKPPTHTDVPVGNAQTPTEAYRMLFAAVKSQDPAKIKLMLSKDTLEGLAQMAAGQQKKTVEEVIANGFTETTFADDYPKTRDERIKEGNAAVEVWNEKRKTWEDLPFVWQDNSWKAGFGDAFSGKWKSPGKGQAVIEQENANANNPNAVVPLKLNNSNGPTKVVKPKLGPTDLPTNAPKP